MKIAVTVDELVHGVQTSRRDLKGAALDRYMASLMRGESPCCGAAIDESEVEPRGRKRGTGPRFCQRCRKELFRL